MTEAFLLKQIQNKKSLLCVGLDTDIKRIPAHLLSEPDPIFAFNKAIIEATADLAIAYKPNLAFYEALGPSGWESLRKTLEIIPDEIFTIADAKRGDIGNTSDLYARAFFETFGFDSVTVAPYMGRDSVEPFLQYEGKWVFLLGLTSNVGADDFQWFAQEGKPLYKEVIEKSSEWAASCPGTLGYVVGATRPGYLKEIREMVPGSFFLVPGVGAQGGTVKDVCENGLNAAGGLFINSSRGIIYAGDGPDFAEKARESAQKLVAEMAEYIPV